MMKAREQLILWSYLLLILSLIGPKFIWARDFHAKRQKYDALEPPTFISTRDKPLDLEQQTFEQDEDKQTFPPDREGNLANLERVLTAIEKATEFFGQDYASINVDGLFGIRLCQGTIIQSLADCSTDGHHCPAQVTRRLLALNHTMGIIANRALPYVQEQDPVYYDKFVQTIDAPYIVQYKPETLGDVIGTKGRYSEYNEELGDECFSILMGTYKDDGRTYPRCTVTEECWSLMTDEGRSGYGITHQLLFFIVAENTGCLPQLEEQIAKSTNYSSVRQFEKQLCGSIYKEAVEEEVEGKVKTLSQDLFLEQSLVCGILGFQDFLSLRWMNMILSWQTSRGCFTMPQSLVAIQEKLDRIANDQRHLLKMLIQEARDIDRASWTGRKLMREQVMKDDCLAHKTGLAFGTLGVYLRCLTRQILL